MEAKLDTPSSGNQKYWTIDDLAHKSWPTTKHPGGLSAGDLSAHGDVVAMLAAVGASITELHAIDHQKLSFSNVPNGWEELFREVQTAVDSERFDPARLPTPYDRYDSADLLRIVSDGKPAKEDLAICHGALLLDCVLIETGGQQQSRATGFVGEGPLRIADRHFDLASLHLDIHHRVGGDGVFAFYDHYRIEPSLIALDHYVLIHHLLGTGIDS